MQTACSSCGGQGSVIRNPCDVCQGNGAISHTVVENLNIPKGVDTGVNLRMSKKVKRIQV
jgi:molecular chaperone DnaJ